MASVEEGVFKKLSAGLADQRLSPAILAMKMTRENRAVNEAMLGLIVNYIVIMASKPLVPFQMKEIHDTCKNLKLSLEELGLTGTIQTNTQIANEYITV